MHGDHGVAALAPRRRTTTLVMSLLAMVIGCGDHDSTKDDRQDDRVVHAWALGSTADGVVVLSSVDHGKEWRTQSPFGNREPTAIAFANARHGWAVGDFGFSVFQTSDAGETWQTRSIGLSHVGDVATLDARRAVVVGSTDEFGCDGDCPSAGVVTRDAGESWSRPVLADPPATGILRSVCITDRGTGVAVGSATFPFIRNAILVTRDAGATWVNTPDPLGLGTAMVGGPPGTIGEVGTIVPVAAACGGDHTLWIAGTRSPTHPSTRFALVRSDDRGKSWTDLSGGTPPGVTVDALAFADAGAGWATVHADDGSALILRTVDGGVTWRIASRTDASATLVTIAFAGSVGMAAGTVSTENGGSTAGGYLTEDGGMTWTTVRFPDGVRLVTDVALVQ